MAVAATTQTTTWDSIDRAYTSFQTRMNEAQKTPLKEQTDEQLKDLRRKVEASIRLLQGLQTKAPKGTIQAVVVSLNGKLVESEADKLLNQIGQTLEARHPPKLKTAMAKTCFCWECMMGKQPYYMGPVFVFDDQPPYCNNENTDPKQLYPQLPA